MASLVERQIPPRALMTGFRAIGYSFSTAVADIIDNSISARSKDINVFSDPLADNPYFCILDNGCGMNKDELDNAMLLGSDRSEKEDNEWELGRYGLGLKSASLSQCRSFIVVSKKQNALTGMEFNLDIIEKNNKLLLKILEAEELLMLPKVNELLKYSSGTLVIWQNFDRIENSSKNFEQSFRMVVAEAKKHVEMVYHRFFDIVNISFDGKHIEKRDPFLKGSIGRQQKGRTLTIDIDGNEITIVPYTLPFQNTLTDEEKNLLGNPKSIYDDQGLYIYRNKRLILWGSWMKLGVRSELNKLARIQVDIPSTLDAVWSLDVKKSAAKIPDKIRDLILVSVKDSIVRSKRTHKFKGIKEKSSSINVWNRILENEGVVHYEINRDLPIIESLSSCLGNNEKELLYMLISQIENHLPQYSIYLDNADAVKITNGISDAEEEILINELEKWLSMCDEEKKETMLDKFLQCEGYQVLAAKKELVKRRLLSNV